MYRWKRSYFIAFFNQFLISNRSNLLGTCELYSPLLLCPLWMQILARIIHVTIDYSSRGSIQIWWWNPVVRTTTRFYLYFVVFVSFQRLSCMYYSRHCIRCSLWHQILGYFFIEFFSFNCRLTSLLGVSYMFYFTVYTSAWYLGCAIMTSIFGLWHIVKANHIIVF